MDFFRQHILSIIAFWPLLGMFVLFFINKENKSAIKWWANFVGIAGFLISLPLWFWFDRATADEMQFVENVPWIQTLGANYHVGIDGISLLLVMLTTLLGPLAILSSWTAIETRLKEYYAFMLMLQTGMLGVFISLDFFLFYVFWEVMLVPMYFLIGVWGGPRKLYAAIKFFLYTLVGSVLLLLGILALYFSYPAIAAQHPEISTVFGAGNTFDILAFQAMGSFLPANLQWWIFLAFFVGFAIKVPMFPFHTWLPDAHVEAPTAGSVILAAVLLKMGTYGFLRFSLPILPSGTKQFIPLMITLSIIAIIYGALVAMMQPDMKKLVAYSSVSHMGFVTLGMFALNPPGLNGSVIQQINHGISTGALFLIVGIIYERRHTREISQLGGLSNVMPIYATVFLIMTMSSIGLPLLNGFIGEFTIMVGALQENLWWAVAAGSGIILGAAYMLWLYQRTMFGRIENPANEKLLDMNLRELATLVPLIIVAFWIGLYPAPFFGVLEKPVNKIVLKVRPDYSLGAPRLNARAGEQR
ncbi:MAG: NADH-quinone oxidoreductase subunit M [Acidobacteria bacterium]|nr:MAG: NADH-quinone oxidoreductase subunit M [Acidobacteriota bacterium]